jgi:uncharacterized protein (DUF885 family)
MTGAPSPVFGLGDAYLHDLAECDPLVGFMLGTGDVPAGMTDFSSAGEQARADLAAATLRQLDAVPAVTVADRRAALVLREKLTDVVQLWEHRDPCRNVRMHFTPPQMVHDVASHLPLRNRDDAGSAVDYLSRIPTALAGYRSCLQDGVRDGIVAARRQALVCAKQAATWGGPDAGLARVTREAAALLGASGAGAAERAGSAARNAYAELADFFVDEYAAAASEADAVGEDRYVRAARAYLGSDVDARATYEWGWEEVLRIEREMRIEAARLSDAPVAAVLHALDTDPDYGYDDPAALIAWMQALVDDATERLDGRSFDIPPQARRVEVLLAPPGGPLMPNYIEPSEDFSRPGRVTVATGDRTWFPTWVTKAVMYHEGVPGHHLQASLALTAPPTDMSRFQRVMGFSTGHGEGWALYAERLMDELGFLDEPAYRLGMLQTSHLRAARVVLDIGLHLELAVSERWEGEGVPATAKWTPELAQLFLTTRTGYAPDLAAGEVDRYLGVPGQAISYKVGEDVWNRVRRRQERQPGFALKAFHTAALSIGPMGLAAFEADPLFHAA